MKNAQHSKAYMYKRIVDAKLYIDAHFYESIDLEKISNQANFSKFHFLRLFKNAFGKSPHQYLIEKRISYAKELLKELYSISEVCYKVGFESVPSFINLFKKKENITPKQFISRHKKLEQQKKEAPFSAIPNCFAESYHWKE